MPDYSIGVDLGGTNLRAAAVDRDGKMLDKISGSTKFNEGREAVLSDIVSAIPTLRERHGTAGLAGIGVGVPGFIRMKEGFITGSNNLPYLENFPVRDEISRRLGTRVILENDANAAAIGEHWIGAGKGIQDLVLLTLGTGIGGGIVSCGTDHSRRRRDGGRVRSRYSCAERQSLRLRQSRLPREARVCDGGHGDGAPDATRRGTERARGLRDRAAGSGKAGDKAREIWKIVGECLGHRARNADQHL